MAVRLSALCASHPLHPRKIHCTHFCHRLSQPRAIVQLEGLGKLKKSTSLGLEPATFQLVAWCLNQLWYHMPLIIYQLMCEVYWTFIAEYRCVYKIWKILLKNRNLENVYIHISSVKSYSSALIWNPSTVIYYVFLKLLNISTLGWNICRICIIHTTQLAKKCEHTVTATLLIFMVAWIQNISIKTINYICVNCINMWLILTLSNFSKNDTHYTYYFKLYCEILALFSISDTV
jgi:hypothetical protein